MERTDERSGYQVVDFGEGELAMVAISDLDRARLTASASAIELAQQNGSSVSGNK